MQLELNLQDLLAYKKTKDECTHGVVFDADDASSMATSYEVRKKYPRLDGKCLLGCGYIGISYVSMQHYMYGDW